MGSVALILLVAIPIVFLIMLALYPDSPSGCPAGIRAGGESRHKSPRTQLSNLGDTCLRARLH